MRNRLPLVLAAALALSCLGVARSAHAQGYGGGYYSQPPQRGLIRSGLILGGSLGIGAIADADCKSCDSLGAFGLQAHIGGMIAPQLAIVFDMSALYHVFEDSSLLTSATFLGVIRGWLGRIFWLEAGLGLGFLEASDQWGYVEGNRTGGAALIGAGVEVLQTYNFALDIQLRISGARFSAKDTATGRSDGFGITNVGLFLGFNWY